MGTREYPPVGIDVQYEDTGLDSHPVARIRLAHCPDCGLYVYDTDAHDEWHDALRTHEHMTTARIG